MQPISGVEAIRMEQDTAKPGDPHSLLYDEYQYEPLIAEDAVRTLVLEAADDFESPLQCSIIQCRRHAQSRSESGCEYSAVSYTWGDCELSHQLFVRLDAQSWSCPQITENVDSLLRYLRVPYKPRLLWVDAICLNQSDETEKTQQIPLMGRIYSDAKRVHIWLGDDETDKAQHAFAIIRTAEREDHWRVTKQEIQCLAGLFNRPWFSRRWIIQEAVFSHDAIFHCGLHSLSLSRVMTTLGKIKGARDHDLVGHGARMLLSSVGSRHISEKGLLSLLWDLHESECSDPRDRIAAVYALVTDGTRPLLRYGTHWTEIYRDVASYFINNVSQSRVIDGIATSRAVLLHLCNFGSVRSEEGWMSMSWVPDWSKRRSELLPYAPNEPGLYSCRRKNGDFQELNIDWFPISPKRSQPSDVSAKQTRWQRYCSLLRRMPVDMKIEASRWRLRIEYHPLIFFQQCGIADRVIRPSTASNFWQEVAAVFEPLTTARHRSAKTYQSDQDSLVMLLAQMLVKRDEAAGKPWRGLVSYTKEIREGLQAHQDDPDALSTQHKMNVQDISSILSHLAIVRIQATAGPYWAIGPPNSQAGDWFIPLLLSEPSQFVPMMCLRPYNVMGTEELQQTHRDTGMAERCRCFFAKISFLHVDAWFVGPASHCDETPFQPDEKDKQTMLDVIMRANETASRKSLPGPIVFDIG